MYDDTSIQICSCIKTFIYWYTDLLINVCINILIYYVIYTQYIKPNTNADTNTYTSMNTNTNMHRVILTVDKYYH